MTDTDPSDLAPPLHLRDDGVIVLPMNGNIYFMRRPKVGEYSDLLGMFNAINNEVTVIEQASRGQFLANAAVGLQAIRDSVVSGTELDLGVLQQVILDFQAAAESKDHDTYQTLFIDKKYGPWWVEAIRRIIGIEVEMDDLDAWMLNIDAVATVLGHWSRVPLAHGLSPAQRAALEGRRMTKAEKMMDGIR